MQRCRSISVRICPQRRLHSSKSRYLPINTLIDGNLDTFRTQAFLPAVPAVFPQGHFSQLPILQKWFTPTTNNTGELQLREDYLALHKHTQVALELTRSAPPPGESAFERFYAPLSYFLDWTKHASSTSPDRLYLAQSQTMDLPPELHGDIPTPQVVARAGKGDVYDTNIWIGLAPTYTPLHRDPNPNLFVQVAGSKVVRLFTPEIGSGIFHMVQRQLNSSASASMRGVEMMEGEEKGLLEQVVWGVEGEEEKAPGYEASLQAGDGLFIPKGWWHSIKGVGHGITGSVNWWFR